MIKNKITPQKNDLMFLLLSILFLIIFLFVFKNSLSHEFLYYDDDIYLLNNKAIHQGLNLESIKWSFTTFYSANYHPITWLSHLTDMSLFKFNPYGHHLTNIILHFFSTLLFFLIAFKLSRNKWIGLISAFIFSLHPTHIEPVMWISQRKELLSALFMYSSIYTYLFYREANQKKLFFYILFIFFFILSLLSKPSSIMMPLLLILIDYFISKKIKITNIIQHSPLYLISTCSSYLTILAQSSYAMIHYSDSIIYKIKFVFISYLLYLKKFFFPINLVVHEPLVKNLNNFLFIFSLIIFLIISYLTFKYRKRFYYLFFGWWWFVLSSIPIIGIMRIGNHMVTNRYCYTIYTGLIIALAYLIVKLYNKFKKQYRYLLLLIFLCLFSLMIGMSRQQVNIWKNGITLFTHNAKKYPNDQTVLLNLGYSYFKKGNLEKAEYYYKKGLENDIKNYYLLINLAYIYKIQGKYRHSLIAYKQIVENNYPNFDFAPIYNDLGLLHLMLQEYSQATYYFQEAIRLKDDYIQAYANMALMYTQTNRLQDALLYTKKALELNPSDSPLLNNLGRIYLELGQKKNAYKYFKKSLQVDPDNKTAQENINLLLQNDDNLS